MTNLEYAMALREHAEENACPEYYEEAGEAFFRLGMFSAARRMFDRAEHYHEEGRTERVRRIICPCGEVVEFIQGVSNVAR